MASRNLLLSKYRGTLMGGLMGDCLAAPFEGEIAVSLPQVNTYISQLFDPKLKVPYKPYTDDTVMTKAVADSLIEHKGVKPVELAKRFTSDYFLEPKRGYGASVHDVFMNFRMNGFEDPFYAARKQFSGQGSYGNGAAMRAAPIGLFYYSQPILRLISKTSDVSRITHAHPLGVQGAILQALAVREALFLDPSKEIDFKSYLRTLLTHMEQLEKDGKKEVSFASSIDQEVLVSYTQKLRKVEEFLLRDSLPPLEEIQEELGVEVEAFNSVPTAIFIFLLSRRPIAGLDVENQVLRSIAYAVSLGGDTDTIGSMAASISGAHLGYEGIPEPLVCHCEKPAQFLKLADDLLVAAEEIQNESYGYEL